MSEVLAFKLRGGHEIVAEVTSVQRQSSMLVEGAAPSPITSYTLRRPHLMHMQSTPNGIGLSFVPWTLSNPTIERLELPASEVILAFSPSSNCERQYLEQTSGIPIAPAGSRIST